MMCPNTLQQLLVNDTDLKVVGEERSFFLNTGTTFAHSSLRVNMTYQVMFEILF